MCTHNAPVGGTGFPIEPPKVRCVPIRQQHVASVLNILASYILTSYTCNWVVLTKHSGLNIFISDMNAVVHQK